MLDKIWTHFNLVIPKVLLFKPKKPCRKWCEVTNREISFLEKDKKEALIMNYGVVVCRVILSLLRCIAKIEFCHSKDGGARALTMGKGRTVMRSWWRYKVCWFCCCQRGGQGNPVQLGCPHVPASFSSDFPPRFATGKVSRKGIAT